MQIRSIERLQRSVRTAGEMALEAQRTMRYDDRWLKDDVDVGSLTGATRLYERAGMCRQQQSIICAKELRPGRDLSTQTL